MPKPPPPPTPEGYVERFGVGGRTGLVLAGSAAFTVLFAWLPGDDVALWVLKVAGLLLFGVGGAWFLSRPVNGWRLDEGRLVEAVAAFAPQVQVVRLEQDGSVRRLGPGG